MFHVVRTLLSARLCGYFTIGIKLSENIPIIFTICKDKQLSVGFLPRNLFWFLFVAAFLSQCKVAALNATFSREYCPQSSLFNHNQYRRAQTDSQLDFVVCPLSTLNLHGCLKVVWLYRFARISTIPDPSAEKPHFIASFSAISNLNILNDTLWYQVTQWSRPIRVILMPNIWFPVSLQFFDKW